MSSDFVNILDPEEVGQWVQEMGKPPDAMPTHLPALNGVCRDEGGGRGIAMGWHCVIGGDTGSGKSLLALNLCRDAVAAGERVGFINLEMSVRQIKTRFYAMLTNTPVRSIEPGDSFDRLAAEEVQVYVAEQVAKHGSHPFYVTQTNRGEILSLISLMGEWLQDGVRVFVIDYLQLCSTHDQDSLNRELVEISTRVRDFAHTHKVVTLALSQYSYAALRSGQRPSWHSLYGSARLGQDSDLCLCLDHTRRERVEDTSTSRTYLIVAKNRHGGHGEIPIEWDYRYLRSREAQPDEVAQWPT